MAADLTPPKHAASVCSAWKSGSNNSAAAWRSKRSPAMEQPCALRYSCQVELLNNPFANRVKNQLGRAVQMQLLQNVPPMRFDRMRAQPQHARDLLIGFPLRQQLENLP